MKIMVRDLPGSQQVRVLCGNWDRPVSAHTLREAGYAHLDVTVGRKTKIYRLRVARVQYRNIKAQQYRAAYTPMPIPPEKSAVDFEVLGKCEFCGAQAIMSVCQLRTPTTKTQPIRICQACLPKTLGPLPPEPESSVVKLQRVRGWLNASPAVRGSIIDAIADLDIVIKRLELDEKYEKNH